MTARRGERTGVCGGGRCQGGGHVAAQDEVNQFDAPVRTFVEVLRHKVETLEHRLEGQAARREFMPAPDAP